MGGGKRWEEGKGGRKEKVGGGERWEEGRGRRGRGDQLSG